jgi:hypothetical protein
MLLPMDMLIRTTWFFAKQAILAIYYKYFAPRVLKGKAWWCILTMMGINVVFSFIQILAIGIRCGRLDTANQSECINNITVLLPAAVFNFVLDVVLFCIPLCCIGRMHLNWRKKYKTMSVFAVGFM